MWLVVGCQSQSSRSDELPRCVRKIERTGDHALIDSNPALAPAVHYLADQQSWQGMAIGAVLVGFSSASLSRSFSRSLDELSCSMSMRIRAQYSINWAVPTFLST